MERIELYEYIRRKTGSGAEALRAEDPDRFAIIETEALRDLVVMNEIAGTGYEIIPGPHTADNPECARLLSQAGIL